MMKKRILYVLMAAFMLASCSESESLTPADSKNEVEFSVKSSVIDVNAKAASRAAYEGGIESANPLTALVLTSKTSFNYATLHCEGTMTFVGADNVVYNKPVNAGSHLFDGSGNYYLSALYPATGWDLAATAGKASRTLTGKEDVMFAPQGATTKTDVSGGTYPKMEFKHQLALLYLHFCGDDEAVDDLETVVTNIELTNVAGAAIENKVEVDLGNGSAQAVDFSGTATELSCYDIDTDVEFATAYPSAEGYYAVTKNYEKIAYTLVPPTGITGNGKEYTFKVYYEVEGEAKSLSVNLDLSKTDENLATGTSTEGYAFDIKLKFIGGQIQATATVTDWKDGGELEIDL